MNIIITGASSGIGYETAIELYKLWGNRILAISRSQDKLQKLINDCGDIKSTSIIDMFTFDLEEDNYEDLVKYAHEFFQINSDNFVDIIINNAGLLINKPLLETSPNDILKSVNTNVNSILKITQSFFPLFAKNRLTHIVNIGSMGGVQGTEKFPGLSAYSISKAAVNAITESMALELSEYNIHTNCINPGAVQTEMLNRAFPGYNAGISASQFGKYLANFALNNGNLMNGRLLSVSLRN